MSRSRTPLSFHPTSPPSTAFRSSKEVSDEVLLVDIAHQSIQALEILYDRYAPGVYALVFRIVNDTVATERLVEAVFINLWKEAGGFVGRGTPGAWIYRTARHTTLDYVRRSKGRTVGR